MGNSLCLSDKMGEPGRNFGTWHYERQGQNRPDVIGKTAGRELLPIFIKWSDDPENEQSVSTWKDVLVEGAKRALALGLRVDDLPMKSSTDHGGLIRPRDVAEGLHIETNASSDLILQWVSRMLKDRNKPKGFLQIVTRAGSTLDLPE